MNQLSFQRNAADMNSLLGMHTLEFPLPSNFDLFVGTLDQIQCPPTSLLPAYLPPARLPPASLPPTRLPHARLPPARLPIARLPLARPPPVRLPPARTALVVV